jgi:molybdopterin/thiamine biosynthesis adenylyltransferase
MMKNKYERQMLFFGKSGQENLGKTKVVIVGVGGIGSHIVQQLAFLGIYNMCLIDNDILDETNKNRLIGVFDDDIEGTKKTDIAVRLIHSINPKCNVKTINEEVPSKVTLHALKESGLIFGCVDNDGARLFINQLSLAYNIPYIDSASDINVDNREFGGRVIFIDGENGCLHCLEEIDANEARYYLEDSNARKDQKAIYGIPKEELKQGGPSVVSLNGIIASLAVTEFLAFTTKIRDPFTFSSYYGSRGIVNNRKVDKNEDCFFCNKIKGLRDNAGLESFFKKT